MRYEAPRTPQHYRLGSLKPRPRIYSVFTLRGSLLNGLGTLPLKEINAGSTPVCPFQFQHKGYIIMSEVDNIARNLDEIADNAPDAKVRDILRVTTRMIPILMRMINDLEARSGLQRSQVIGLELDQVSR